MSEVVSFRLDKDNIREAKALLILQEWRIKGYGVRHIITDALLKLDEAQGEPQAPKLDELNDALKQVSWLLIQLESEKKLSPEDNSSKKNETSLSDSFLSSVKMAVRPGMQIG